MKSQLSGPADECGPGHPVLASRTSLSPHFNITNGPAHVNKTAFDQNNVAHTACVMCLLHGLLLPRWSWM